MSMSNITYKSYFQTTDIILDTQKNGFVYTNGFEMIPVCPVKLDDKPIRINKEGVIYTWYVNGTVERINKKVKTIWFPKPTIQDALNHGRYFPKDRKYFEFKSNGLIKAFQFDKEYIWCSEEEEVNPIEGEFVIGLTCFCGNYNFDGEECNNCESLIDYNDCGCNNNYRCCGWTPYDDDR